MDDLYDSPGALQASLSTCAQSLVQAKSGSTERRRLTDQMLMRLNNASILAKSKVSANVWASMTSRIVDNFSVNLDRKRRSLPPEKEIKLLALLAEQLVTSLPAHRRALHKMFIVASNVLKIAEDKLWKLFQDDKHKPDLSLSQLEKLLLVILKKPGSTSILSIGADGNVQFLLQRLISLLHPPTQIANKDLSNYTATDTKLRRHLCAEVLLYLLRAAPPGFEILGVELLDILDLLGPDQCLPSRDTDHALLASLSLIAEQHPLRFMSVALCEGAHAVALAFDSIVRAFVDVRDIRLPRHRESVRFTRAYCTASAISCQGEKSFGSLCDADVLGEDNLCRLQRILNVIVTQSHSFHRPGLELEMDSIGTNFLLLIGELMHRISSSNANLLLATKTATQMAANSEELSAIDCFPLQDCIANVDFYVASFESTTKSASKNLTGVVEGVTSPGMMHSRTAPMVTASTARPGRRRRSSLGSQIHTDAPKQIWFRQAASPLLNCLQVTVTLMESLLAQVAFHHQRSTDSGSTIPLHQFSAVFGPFILRSCSASVQLLETIFHMRDSASRESVALQLWATKLVTCSINIVNMGIKIARAEDKFDAFVLRVSSWLHRSLLHQTRVRELRNFRLFGSQMELLKTMYACESYRSAFATNSAQSQDIIEALLMKASVGSGISIAGVSVAHMCACRAHGVRHSATAAEYLREIGALPATVHQRSGPLSKSTLHIVHAAASICAVGKQQLLLVPHIVRFSYSEGVDGGLNADGELATFVAAQEAVYPDNLTKPTLCADSETLSQALSFGVYHHYFIPLTLLTTERNIVLHDLYADSAVDSHFVIPAGDCNHSSLRFDTNIISESIFANVDYFSFCNSFRGKASRSSPDEFSNTTCPGTSRQLAGPSFHPSNFCTPEEKTLMYRACHAQIGRMLRQFVQKYNSQSVVLKRVFQKFGLSVETLPKDWCGSDAFHVSNVDNDSGTFSDSDEDEGDSNAHEERSSRSNSDTLLRSTSELSADGTIRVSLWSLRKVAFTYLRLLAGAAKYAIAVAHIIAICFPSDVLPAVWSSKEFCVKECVIRIFRAATTRIVEFSLAATAKERELSNDRVTVIGQAIGVCLLEISNSFASIPSSVLRRIVFRMCGGDHINDDKPSPKRSRASPRADSSRETLGDIYLRLINLMVAGDVRDVKQNLQHPTKANVEFKSLTSPWWFRFCGGSTLETLQAAVASGDGASSFGDEASEEYTKLCRHLNFLARAWRRIRTQQTSCFQDVSCVQGASLPHLAVFAVCHTVLLVGSHSIRKRLLSTVGGLSAEEVEVWATSTLPAQIALSLAEVFFSCDRESKSVSGWASPQQLVALEGLPSAADALPPSLVEIAYGFLKDTVVPKTVGDDQHDSAGSLKPALVLLHQLYRWLHGTVSVGDATDALVVPSKWSDVTKALSSGVVLASLKRVEVTSSQGRVASLLLLQCYFQAFLFDRRLKGSFSKKFFNNIKRIFLRHKDFVVRNCSTSVFRHIAYYASATKTLLSSLVLPNAPLRTKTSEVDMFNEQISNFTASADLSMFLLDRSKPDGVRSSAFMLQATSCSQHSIFVSQDFHDNALYFLFFARDGRWYVTANEAHAQARTAKGFLRTRLPTGHAPLGPLLENNLAFDSNCALQALLPVGECSWQELDSRSQGWVDQQDIRCICAPTMRSYHATAMLAMGELLQARQLANDLDGVTFVNEDGTGVRSDDKAWTDRIDRAVIVKGVASFFLARSCMQGSLNSVGGLDYANYIGSICHFQSIENYRVACGTKSPALPFERFRQRLGLILLWWTEGYVALNDHFQRLGHFQGRERLLVFRDMLNLVPARLFLDRRLFCCPATQLYQRSFMDIFFSRRTDQQSGETVHFLSSVLSSITQIHSLTNKSRTLRNINRWRQTANSVVKAMCGCIRSALLYNEFAGLLIPISQVLKRHNHFPIREMLLRELIDTSIARTCFEDCATTGWTKTLLDVLLPDTPGREKDPGLSVPTSATQQKICSVDLVPDSKTHCFYVQMHESLLSFVRDCRGKDTNGTSFANEVALSLKKQFAGGTLGIAILLQHACCAFREQSADNTRRQRHLWRLANPCDQSSFVAFKDLSVFHSLPAQRNQVTAYLIETIATNAVGIVPSSMKHKMLRSSLKTVGKHCGSTFVDDASPTQTTQSSQGGHHSSAKVSVNAVVRALGHFRLLLSIEQHFIGASASERCGLVQVLHWLISGRGYDPDPKNCTQKSFIRLREPIIFTKFIGILSQQILFVAKQLGSDAALLDPAHLDHCNMLMHVVLECITILAKQFGALDSELPFSFHDSQDRRNISNEMVIRHHPDFLRLVLVLIWFVSRLRTQFSSLCSLPAGSELQAQVFVVADKLSVVDKGIMSILTTILSLRGVKRTEVVIERAVPSVGGASTSRKSKVEILEPPWSQESATSTIIWVLPAIAINSLTYEQSFVYDANIVRRNGCDFTHLYSLHGDYRRAQSLKKPYSLVICCFLSCFHVGLNVDNHFGDVGLVCTATLTHCLSELLRQDFRNGDLGFSPTSRIGCSTAHFVRTTRSETFHGYLHTLQTQQGGELEMHHHCRDVLASLLVTCRDSTSQTLQQLPETTSRLVCCILQHFWSLNTSETAAPIFNTAHRPQRAFSDAVLSRSKFNFDNDQIFEVLMLHYQLVQHPTPSIAQAAAHVAMECAHNAFVSDLLHVRLDSEIKTTQTLLDASAAIRHKGVLNWLDSQFYESRLIRLILAKRVSSYFSKQSTESVVLTATCCPTLGESWPLPHNTVSLIRQIRCEVMKYLDNGAGEICGIKLLNGTTDREQLLEVQKLHRAASTAVLFDEDLWLRQSSKFDAWIRSVTVQLIHKLCADDTSVMGNVLRAMQPLCSISSSTSQLLFPHVVLHILRMKGSHPFYSQQPHTMFGSDDQDSDGATESIATKVSALFTLLLRAQQGCGTSSTETSSWQPSLRCLRTVIATVHMIRTSKGSGLLSLSKQRRISSNSSSASASISPVPMERTLSGSSDFPSFAVDANLFADVALQLHLPLVALQALEYSRDGVLELPCDDSDSFASRLRCSNDSVGSNDSQALRTQPGRTDQSANEAMKQRLLNIFQQRGDVHNAVGASIQNFEAASASDFHGFSVASDLRSRLAVYETGHRHALSLVHRDIILDQSPLLSSSAPGSVDADSQEGFQALLQSLHQDGRYSTLRLCARGLSEFTRQNTQPANLPANSESAVSRGSGGQDHNQRPNATVLLSEFHFQIAARLGQWEVPAPAYEHPNSNASTCDIGDVWNVSLPFHESLFFATRALIARNESAFSFHCASARHTAIGWSRDGQSASAATCNSVLQTVSSSHHPVHSMGGIRASPSSRVLFDNYRIQCDSLPIDTADAQRFVRMKIVDDLSALWRACDTSDSLNQLQETKLLRLVQNWRDEMERATAFDRAKPLLESRMVLLELADSLSGAANWGDINATFFPKHYFMTSYAAFARRCDRSSIAQRILLNIESSITQELFSQNKSKTPVIQRVYNLDTTMLALRTTSETRRKRKMSNSDETFSNIVPFLDSSFCLLTKAKIALEDAFCSWAQQEPTRAISIAVRISTSLRQHGDAFAKHATGTGSASKTTQEMSSSLKAVCNLVHAESRFQAGLWIARRHIKDTTEIFSDFFEPAIQEVQDALAWCKHNISVRRKVRSASYFGIPFAGFDTGTAFCAHANAVQCRIMYTMAQYMFERYRNAQVEASSADSLRWVRVKESYEADLKHYNKLRDAHKGSISQAQERQITRQIADTEKKLRVVGEKLPDETAVKKVLAQTIETYGNFIRVASCDRSITAVTGSSSPSASFASRVSNVIYRLIGLWFEHCEDTQINDMMSALVGVGQTSAPSGNVVPTYLFVDLLRQLCSRLENHGANSGRVARSRSPVVPAVQFQHILQSLVQKIGETHIYHVVAVLFPLTKGQDVDDTHTGRCSQHR